MKKKMTAAVLAMLTAGMLMSGCGSEEADDSEIVLRVANWEEYIDLGGWEEDEVIDLEDGTEIFGENSLVDDFEDWFYETYGRKVKVEYSTFGTCEELYNQLTIGDVYDVASPSEYMIMKMMREGMLVPYSDDFKDTSDENNYYMKGVSPYIKSRLDALNINGESVSDYASGYMWGTLGIVYNPEEVTDEEAAHWDLMVNPKFNRRVTVKDSVRDAYFAALTYNYYDEITSDEFLSDPEYHEKLTEILNRTDEETVNSVEDVLTRTKNNVYSFETDSGKADMVTGKVVANEQWSGDAVYTMDQADEDGVELCYSAPSEGTNLWFDGWILLKCGIGDDADKQMAAEAWVNFLSKPENAIRNMYYIGYTSVISGGDSDLIFEYLDWNYSAEDDEEDTVEYDVSWFFEPVTDDAEVSETEDAACGDTADGGYIVTTTEDQTRRQLYAQYPTKDVVDRSVVMACFNDEDNERINRMWTNVRCFDLNDLFGRK